MNRNYKIGIITSGIAVILISIPVYLFWMYSPEAVYRRGLASAFWLSLDNDTRDISVSRGETKIAPVELHHWKDLDTALYVELRSDGRDMDEYPSGLSVSYDLDSSVVSLSKGAVMVQSSNEDARLNPPTIKQVSSDGEMVVREIGKLTVSVSRDVPIGSYDFELSSGDTKIDGGGGNSQRLIVTVVDANDGQQSTMQPAGISVNIEGYGRREFYQDENVGLPTNLTISDASVFGKDAVISWPSIGPNYVITTASIGSASDEVVLDYYKSLAIEENLSQLRYDEFVNTRELEPPPAVTGRYFGFDWNQTDLDGTRVEPGTYQVILTMPVVIEEQGQKKIITLTSQPDSFTIIEGKPISQAHNLSLEYNVNNTNLLTGEPYSFSLYLINNGNQTESFTMDHNSEEGSCYWRHTGRLEHPDHILPPGGRVDLTGDNNVGAAAWTPGLYPYTPFVMLSIDEPERVECLKVEANTITLNVTAPVYEGVKLVITTDKQIYQRNETIAIALYIENNSDKPFKLQEVSPSISIKDDNGREVNGMSWIADYSIYPTVEPHSRYSLTSSIPFNWDQTVNLEDGSSRPAEPGEYSILATFTYPYLKSEELAIWIED